MKSSHIFKTACPFFRRNNKRPKWAYIAHLNTIPSIDVKMKTRGKLDWIISDRHKKHKLDRGLWGFASYQVSSKSIQRLWRRSRKIFQPIRVQGGHLGFLINKNNTNLIEGFKDLLPVKFHQNPFSSCGEEVKKCFSQSEARAAILDFRWAWKTQTW